MSDEWTDRNQWAEELARQREARKGPCPAPDRLADYARGRLAGVDAEALLDHTALCPACQERLLAQQGREHPVGWDAFAQAAHTADAREPQKILLYVNGEPAGECPAGAGRSGRIRYRAAGPVASVEIKNERGDLLEYVDPALYAGQRIETEWRPTPTRRVRTTVRLQGGGADIEVRYQGALPLPARLRTWLTKTLLPVLRVPGYAALAAMLMLVPYWMIERQRQDRLRQSWQATVADYERQVGDLRQQAGAADRAREAAQGALAGLQQAQRQPQLVASRYEVVVPPDRSGSVLTKPLTVRFSGSSPSVGLVLFPSALDYKTYQVRIYDGTGRALVWSSPEQPLAHAGAGGGDAALALTLSADFLPSGHYRLRLYGLAPPAKLLADYTLRVAHE